MRWNNGKKKKNDDLRNIIKEKGVYCYEVAEHVGIHETTLMSWLRHYLSDEKRKLILKAVEELS